MSEIKVDTIYNKDYAEIIKKMDDESIDLILTDPPYGIDYQNNFTHEKHEKIKGDEEGIDYEFFARECYRVLKNNSHAYFFTRFDTYPYHYEALIKAGFQIKNCLIIEKGQIGGCGDLRGSFANNSEWVIFCQKGRKVFNETKLLKNSKEPGKAYNKGGPVLKEYKTRFPACWFGNEYPKSTYNSSWQKKTGIKHPTVKNTDCLEWFIKISCCKNGIVFDPFGGSGSTYVAAINCGVHYIGCEIMENFYGIIKDRITKLNSKNDEAM